MRGGTPARGRPKKQLNNARISSSSVSSEKQKQKTYYAFEMSTGRTDLTRRPIGGPLYRVAYTLIRVRVRIYMSCVIPSHARAPRPTLARSINGNPRGLRSFLRDK